MVFDRHPTIKLIVKLMNRSLVLHLIMQSHIFFAKIAEYFQISKKIGVDILLIFLYIKALFSIVLARNSYQEEGKIGENRHIIPFPSA